MAQSYTLGQEIFDFARNHYYRVESLTPLVIRRITLKPEDGLFFEYRKIKVVVVGVYAEHKYYNVTASSLAQSQNSERVLRDFFNSSVFVVPSVSDKSLVMLDKPLVSAFVFSPKIEFSYFLSTSMDVSAKNSVVPPVSLFVNYSATGKLYIQAIVNSFITSTNAGAIPVIRVDSSVATIFSTQVTAKHFKVFNTMFIEMSHNSAGGLQLVASSRPVLFAPQGLRGTNVTNSVMVLPNSMSVNSFFSKKLDYLHFGRYESSGRTTIIWQLFGKRRLTEVYGEVSMARGVFPVLCGYSVASNPSIHQNYSLLNHVSLDDMVSFNVLRMFSALSVASAPSIYSYSVFEDRALTPIIRVVSGVIYPFLLRLDRVTSLAKLEEKFRLINQFTAPSGTLNTQSVFFEGFTPPFPIFVKAHIVTPPAGVVGVYSVLRKQFEFFTDHPLHFAYFDSVYYPVLAQGIVLSARRILSSSNEVVVLHNFLIDSITVLAPAFLSVTSSRSSFNAFSPIYSVASSI